MRVAHASLRSMIKPSTLAKLGWQTASHVAEPVLSVHGAGAKNKESECTINIKFGSSDGE